MTTTSRPQMTTPERIVFAAGDIFGGGGAALISVLYLFYLTDVIGIAPGYAGLALLIPKIWDAINDPLMGALSDNARTRWGRRRPFIAVGGSLLAFAMAAIWAPIAGGGAGAGGHPPRRRWGRWGPACTPPPPRPWLRSRSAH